MKDRIPRILIAGTGSGCGKTTVTCGLLSALRQSGMRTSAFKCGPDYIDPMFHKEVLGTDSGNLDLYLCGEETVKYLLARGGRRAELTVTEGVMGLYDGRGFNDDRCSANHISRLTETPVVLVADVKGKSLSLAAELNGYVNFRENRIRGVILNHCSAAMYPEYAELIRRETGLPCFGYLPNVPEAEVGSRHLGLITAAEIADIRQKMDALGKVAGECLDMDGLRALAETAPELSYEEPEILREISPGARYPVAIAKDRAFCFYYRDALELLEQMGAELIPFSPLTDSHLPTGSCGLILGGGYPELYAETLSGNKTLLKEIRTAVRGGLPTYAECGGFMYLGQSITTAEGRFPMAGAIPGNSRVTGHPVRFGYKELTARRDNLLCRRGGRIRCHEFHYSDTDDYGDGFEAVNSRGRSWETGQVSPSLYAGYPHLHLWGNPEFARSFMDAVRRTAQGEGGITWK